MKDSGQKALARVLRVAPWLALALVLGTRWLGAEDARPVAVPAPSADEAPAAVDEPKDEPRPPRTIAAVAPRVLPDEATLLHALERETRLPSQEELILRLGVVGTEASLEILTTYAEVPRLRWPVATAVGRIGGPEAIAVLDRWVKGKDPELRDVALTGLGLVGPEGTKRLLARLATAPASERPVIYNALAEGGSAEARVALVEAFHGDREGDVRAAAAALVRVGGAEDELIRAARDGRRVERRAAVAALTHVRTPAARRVLMDAASSADSIVRSEALVAIGQMEDAEAVDLLCSVAASGPGDARMTAIGALGRRDTPKSRETLLALLEDGDRNSAWAVTSALASLGGKEVREALATAARSGDRQVRQSAVTALAQLDGPEAEETLAALVDDADPSVALSAVYSYVALAGDRALPVLERLVREGRPDVRAQAVQQLAAIDDPAAMQMLVALSESDDALLGDAAIEALIASGAGDTILKDKLVARLEDGGSSAFTVAYQLARVGGDDARRALMAAMTDGQEQVASAAQYALTQFDRGTVLADVTAVLDADDASPAVRTRMIRLLGTMGGEEAEGLLLASLEGGDPQTVAAALDGLAQSGRPQNVDRIAPLLASEDPSVRQSALSAIGSLGGEEAVAALAPYVASDDISLRSSAMWALAQANTDGAREQLYAAASDADPGVRGSALMVLQSVRDGRSREVMRAGLEDADATVRQQAVSALASGGGVRDLEALAARLESESDDGVRRSIAFSLQAAGGRVARDNAALIESVLAAREALPEGVEWHDGVLAYPTTAEGMTPPDVEPVDVLDEEVEPTIEEVPDEGGGDLPYVEGP